MVSDDDLKIATIPPFPLRMQQPLRTGIETAARVNRRSVNSEIVARLAQSFDMAAPIEPGEPIASETAKDALALAKENQRHIEAVEDALRAVCDDVYIDGLPDKVAAIFIELSRRLSGL